jgi:ABC-type nitrate/sulfonate/bicarbonate transport system substrate-binding protein
MDALGAAKGERRLVPIPGPRLAAALKYGRVDAFISLEPWPSQALKSLKERVHLLLPPRGKAIYVPSLYLVSTGPVLERQPEAVTLFLAGIVKARQFIKKEPDSAAAILAGVINLKLADIQAVLPSFSYPVNLDRRAKRQLQDISQWLKEEEGLDLEEPVTEFFAPEFLARVDPGSVTMGR